MVSAYHLRVGVPGFVELTVTRLGLVHRDPSHPPKRVTNAKGKLVLGHYEDGDETSEHLNYRAWACVASGGDLEAESLTVVC